MKFFTLFILTSIIFLSCSKDPSTSNGTGSTSVLPTITTVATGSITSSSAISGGNVSSDGGATIASRGVCWNTSSNPVITGNHTSDGTGTGTFSSILTGLTANTTYYVRAYAANNAGTAYGNELSFVTAPAPLINTDSAKMFFITTSTSSANNAIGVYDAMRTKLWEQALTFTANYWAKPDFADNKLFFSVYNLLMNVNSGSGTNNWTYTNTYPLVNPKVVNDTIVTASALISPPPSNMLLMLSKITGAVIWSLSTGTNEPLTTPSLDGGKIFALTTNPTGTVFNISAYDIITKTLLWQNTINGFVTSGSQEMMTIRNDTLIVNTAAAISVINKNTGSVYWTKSLNTNRVEIYNNKIVYQDQYLGKVNVLNLQTGNIINQGQYIDYTHGSGLGASASYIYNDAFYYRTGDSVYCTGISDGMLRWRKQLKYYYYFTKFIAIENLVYGAFEYSTPNESRIMIMNASDLSIRDSIVLQKPWIKDLTILSAKNKLY